MYISVLQYTQNPAQNISHEGAHKESIIKNSGAWNNGRSPTCHFAPVAFVMCSLAVIDKSIDLIEKILENLRDKFMYMIEVILKILV